MPEYKKDYWGFVYLWRDRRSGMYCVGSHLGHLKDYYISSTGNLKQAYKKRRSDFKRRIIYWLPKDDRELLLNEENRWLSFIKPSELSTVSNFENGTVRYYNCKQFAMGGAWNKGRSGVQLYHRKVCIHCGRSFTAGMYAAWHGDLCLKNPSLKPSDKLCRARKKKIKQPSYVANNVNCLPHETCDVCGISTSRGNIARWHNAKCVPRRSRLSALTTYAGTRDQLTKEWA